MRHSSVRLITGPALAAALMMAACSGTTPLGSPAAGDQPHETEDTAAAPEETTAAEAPEETAAAPVPVTVRLDIAAAADVDQAARGTTSARRLFSTDDEDEQGADSEGSLVPSTAIVTEGGQFRLMVRFDGTIPIRGTCTISLSDSGGHAMADVTATANGFDASTELITVEDDDEVTDDRTITATLVSCDLPEIDSYEIGEPNTAAVLVRDHDPVQGTGGVPAAPWQQPPPEPEPEWTPVSATATLSASSTFSACWSVSVNVSPSLPALPDPDASYSVEINFTVVFPDGRDPEYAIIKQAFNSGGGTSRSICARSSWPAGTSVRASLDAFHEIYPTTGVAQFITGSRYGSYSIGSPSSATATLVAE